MESKDLPLITIGIPVVKSMYLLNAIQCAIAQSYENLEIIILNNAATIEVRTEIEKIVNSLNDDRIIYHVNAEQLPIIQNWNKLVSLSAGVFFSLLSDDDYWDKEFITETYKLSVKYPGCSLFHSRVAVVDADDKIMRLTPLCNDFEDDLDFIWHRLMDYRIQYVSDFLVKLGSLKKIGGFFDLPGAWGSDDLTWFLVAEKGGVAYTSQVLYYYRENPFNVTNTMRVKNMLLANRVFTEQIIKLIGKSDKEIRIDMIKQTLMSNLLRRNLFAIRFYFNTKKKLSKVTYMVISLFYRVYFKSKYKYLSFEALSN